MFEVTHYSKVISNLRKNPQSNEELKRDLKFIGNKIKSSELLRLIFIILLYSSIVSGVLSIFPGLQPFLKQILKISGIIGSTFCLIMVAITSRYIGLYIIDLQLTAVKIIHKNGIRRTKLWDKKK